MKIGGQTEFGKIEKILIKHPKDTFINQANIDSNWKDLNYFDRPDFSEAVAEYEKFADLLKSEISEVHFLPANEKTGMDSIYPRDASIVCNGGVVLCNMGKQLRQDEPVATGEYLTTLGIPILGEITGDGRVEGGDIIWLNDRTLVVGRGYRTNDEGIRQLKELTADFIDELVVVPLPHWRGPADVFHLMSFISPIDYDLAVVYSRLMPIPFREMLIERGMTLVEVPDSEYSTMACNILAIAPRKCIMLSGNPIVRRMLEEHGAEVHEFKGDEISRKGAGGPTCMTRPLIRSG
jgi:N-dimethylarginine dimethylaminohydrolase